MSLPDNRIRLPSAKIDFVTDVGVTGQDHDNYPAPQAQARFDHMRMYLIGLLAQQSSYTEPTEKRDGTPWFDLTTLSLKIYLNGEWAPYSSVIALTTTSPIVTLSDWYASTNEALASLAAEIVFGGKATSVSSDVTIPEPLRSSIYSNSKAFVFVNGVAIDPRTVSFIGSPSPTLLRFSDHELESGDEFFVSIRRIPVSTFYTQDVSVP